MTKACLAIGVGDAPPLDYLRGAVNGAHAIARWAQRQGYTTKLLTDEQDPVELQDVKAALEALLAGGAEHLVVYFAGHGFSLPMAVADDLWLLSRWNLVRRGVSMNQLRHRLRFFGLRRLVFISDACRSLLGASAADLVGDPVLERGPFDARTPHQDSWFAASPARAAWMIPGRTPAESRCIFSGLMAEALDGLHEAALDLRQPELGVTNEGLASFLEEQVPLLAARYGARLEPEINTGLRAPDDVYLPAPLSSPLASQRIPWPDPSDVEVAGMGDDRGGGRIEPPPGESWSTQDELLDQVLTRSGGAPERFSRPILSAVIAESTRSIAVSSEHEQAEAAAALLTFEAGRDAAGFATGAGLSLYGADIAHVHLGHHATAREKPSTGWWRIMPREPRHSDAWWDGQGRLRAPLPLLLQLTDGRWVGAAAVPSFVLGFTLEPAGAVAVIYRRSGEPEAPETEQAMARLRAGALRREQAPELVQQLRRAKHADPMLGVLAAYLHDAAADLANVHRTAYFFARRGEPIPFDIALLGQLEARRDADGLVRVSIPAVAEDAGARNMPGYMKRATQAAGGVLAGAFPWLRQGWTRLDPSGQPGLYPAGLADLAAHLSPAPFTTLDAAGGERLARLLFAED